MDWKIHRAILIAAIWIAEVLSAGICGFIAALALIPASYAARGYFAFRKALCCGLPRPEP